MDPKSTAELAPTHRNGSEPDRAYDQLVSDAASEIAESRGPIEQVKGMLEGLLLSRVSFVGKWLLPDTVGAPDDHRRPSSDGTAASRPRV